MELTPEEVRVLATLSADEIAIPELVAKLGIDQAKVAAACTLLAEKGLIHVREVPYVEFVYVGERLGAAWMAPRRRIYEALVASGGPLAMPDVAARAGLDAQAVGQNLRALVASGAVAKQGAHLVATGAPLTCPEEEGLRWFSARTGLLPDAPGGEPGSITSVARESELRAAGVDITALREFGPVAVGKKALLEREKTDRFVRITPMGESRRAGGLEATREVSQITPELLASGEWASVRFKPYDIELATEPFHAGKKHPLQRVLESTRQAFLEMGFEEAVSPYVESGFWDFDALFQPQDHPAREMQDTFYVARPGRTPLPDSDLVDRVRATHEDGGETGSVGWRYRWDPEKAMQNVLRTHTTATTIRALAANPRGPRKVFSIGRVFRRETIDYKHLPIFYQVDGIIIDERASFATLLGTLGAFYERMGFEKFYFRPGFFPYTEPSVEVFIWHEEKQDWFEMGGSGIFRPEVTEPLGCTEPVLAWGLGLDRLAMLLHGRSDIRDLYMSDLSWLREEPRCR